MKILDWIHCFFLIFIILAQESRSGPDRQAQVISKYELKLEKKTLNFSPSESINGEISLALAAGHAMKGMKLLLALLYLQLAIIIVKLEYLSVSVIC
jgi:hypothetical protein